MSISRIPVERPFLGTCPFCRDGILRYWTCKCCTELCILCSRCDCIWKDRLPAVTGKQPDGEFPKCLRCSGNLTDGHESNMNEINVNGLADTVVGFYDGD